MKHTLLLASAAALGGMMLLAAPASAYVACNAGDCWHSDKRFTAPGARLRAPPAGKPRLRARLVLTQPCVQCTLSP